MMILKLHKEHSHGNLIQLFSLIFHRISPLLIELLLLLPKLSKIMDY